MQPRKKTFAHRYTPDDKIDSICLTCYLTVARSSDEVEMRRNEAQHACQPDPLPLAFHFSRSVAPSPVEEGLIAPSVPLCAFMYEMVLAGRRERLRATLNPRPSRKR